MIICNQHACAGGTLRQAGPSEVAAQPEGGGGGRTKQGESLSLRRGSVDTSDKKQCMNINSKMMSSKLQMIFND